MDKLERKKTYKKICNVLGFDAPEHSRYTDSIEGLDDQPRDQLSKIALNDEWFDIFVDAYILYRHDRDKFNEIYGD